MSRVGKQPISIPKGVDITIAGKQVTVKGSKGSLTLNLHAYINASQEDNVVCLIPEQQDSAHWAMCGTMRALLNNMVIGVSQGFEKKLQLIGVGYRAQAQGQKLNLSLGFSHPIEFNVPAGIVVETPSQTEILVKNKSLSPPRALQRQRRALRR